MDFIKLIVPGIVAIIGNIIFYWIIKSRIDSSIERSKIAYSGVFKEKIDIYKGVLSRIITLKQTLQKYIHYGENLRENPMVQINDLINFYLINEPFLSNQMIDHLNGLRHDFQTIFEDIYMYHRTTPGKGLSKEKWNDIIDKYYESEEKFKPGSSLSKIENQIIEEMRQDLGTS